MCPKLAAKRGAHRRLKKPKLGQRGKTSSRPTKWEQRLRQRINLSPWIKKNPKVSKKSTKVIGNKSQPLNHAPKAKVRMPWIEDSLGSIPAIHL